VVCLHLFLRSPARSLRVAEGDTIGERWRRPFDQPRRELQRYDRRPIPFTGLPIRRAAHVQWATQTVLLGGPGFVARIDGPVDLHAVRLRIGRRLQRRLQSQPADVSGRRQQRDLLIADRRVRAHPGSDGPSERPQRLFDRVSVHLLVVGDRGLLHNAEHVGASSPRHMAV
jgi:hypothetical protein